MHFHYTKDKQTNGKGSSSSLWGRGGGRGEGGDGRSCAEAGGARDARGTGPRLRAKGPSDSTAPRFQHRALSSFTRTRVFSEIAACPLPRKSAKLGSASLRVRFRPSAKGVRVGLGSGERSARAPAQVNGCDGIMSHQEVGPCGDQATRQSGASELLLRHECTYRS